ncbi:MAG: hypothetical protein A2087_05175 [Spirochaetes bacterium GWD1_61_31]|nr:MAG: hypothetical protein A2Y37_00920 [Spirochaetes bacterium GWB1_60_80]OHD35386.1 MAG: hypothetical protein A2004_09160 [Spirochaetes bacterium GWC1_61_12]OHD36536.1 MAG: hypothetical protein A2087_05175 [Spirochaetes bacterium GWD1_61_31]OHD42250.1 MAG: hypothetical protein A2Y35_09370 [Spirochaetes bacterium GWE1_60_18]OHD58179.1 MAG: hypothetical protein A2Y32_14940 [Spirochaetes bacterium GWF1_60_12]HBO40895.1 hypothetical protein [Spirochaetaceae bacterium]
MANAFSAQRVFERLKKAWEIIQKDTVNYGLMVFVGSLVQAITCGILAGPVSLGMYRGARKLQNEGKVAINDAFSGMSKFGTTFVLILLIGALLGIAFGIITGVTTLLAVIAINLGQAIAIIGAIVGFLTAILTFALWIAYGVLALASGIVLSLGIIMVDAEDLSAVGAIRKAFSWIKANRPAALEFLLGILLCSLLAAIPIVGAIAVIGFSMLFALQVYDSEKEIGNL